jgi:hypothetical protein
LRKELPIMKTKKEEYIDNISSQLKEWSVKIDELESKVGTTKTQVKLEYDRRILDLKEKRDVVSQRLAALRASSGESWEAMKTGVEAAWRELRDGITAARDKFKKAA